MHLFVCPLHRGYEALKEIMTEYARVWDPSPDTNLLRAVGQVWRATNNAVDDHIIGPAVVKDIFTHVEVYIVENRQTRLSGCIHARIDTVKRESVATISS